MTVRTATAMREYSPGLLAIASYPAQRASLTSLVAMAIAMPLTVLPLVGYVVQLVLWAAAYHYAVEVFRRSANGTFAAPEFAPNNHGIGWRLLVLQMLFALGHWALQAYVFPPLPRLLGIGLLALLQPAMTLTVAMNLNLPAAFAIHRVLRVIAALGIGYWLLVLAGVGLGAVQEFVGLVVASGRTYVLVVMAGISQAGAAQVGALFGGSGLLAQVDLNILYLACCAQPAGFGATNTFLLDVYGTPPWNGQPYNATTPLASIPVTVTQTGWLSIDVSSAGLVLSPGQQFALGLRSDVYWDLGIDSSGPYNPYGGGSLYGNGGLIQGNNQGVGAWDLVFKTYLSTPVPEPGTALLVGLGLAALGATRRRDAR